MPTDPFYGSKAWQKLRARMQNRAKKCALCGVPFTKADMKLVDHIKPRRTHPELSLVESNLQVVHQLCHNSIKARMERGQHIPKTGLDGWPEED